MQTTLKTESAPSTVAAFGLVGPLTGESIGGNCVQTIRKAPCILLLCKYPYRTDARAKAVSSQDTLRATGTQQVLSGYPSATSDPRQTSIRIRLPPTPVPGQQPDPPGRQGPLKDDPLSLNIGAWC